MGLTYVNGSVIGESGHQEGVRFLVDSGAQYSLLPKAAWTKIGLQPKDQVECVLADGTVVTRMLGECKFSLLGKERFAQVILGEDTDMEPLLGAITLENFGFVLDPFSRALKVMRVRL